MKTRTSFLWLLSSTLALVCPIQCVASPVVTIAEFVDAEETRNWEPIERAVTDLLVGAVSASGRIRVVDRERLDDLLREQQLTLKGLADKGNSAVIGRLLGADRIVTGRLFIRDDHIRIIAQIVDVHTAVIQATCQAEGPMADLLGHVTDLARDLSEQLEIPFDPGRIEAIDNHPIVSVNFLRGLGFFYTGEYELAIRDFMTSGDLDPDLTERHYWKARAYMALDDFELARLELIRYLTVSPEAGRAPESRRLLDKCNLVLSDPPQP